jgi:Protein of unknown function DUF2617
MGSDIVRPPVSDLVFQLYGRPLHPELFEIGASRRITRGEFGLDVRITRTGHVITWHNAAVMLTEVTASADQELPQRRRLLNHRFHFEQSTALDCAHGMRYHASFQVETLSAEQFAHVHDEILADGAKRGFLHHFPSEYRLSREPLGYVNAEFRPGCLFLSSFHTFPGELTVIKTQSLIESGG